MAFAMMGVASALDVWWALASIFSGGMLGLFLLGLISRASNAAAATGVVVGVLVIVWMTISAKWPERWPSGQPVPQLHDHGRRHPGHPAGGVAGVPLDAVRGVGHGASRFAGLRLSRLSLPSRRPIWKGREAMPTSRCRSRTARAWSLALASVVALLSGAADVKPGIRRCASSRRPTPRIPRRPRSGRAAGPRTGALG